MFILEMTQDWNDLHHAQSTSAPGKNSKLTTQTASPDCLDPTQQRHVLYTDNVPSCHCQSCQKGQLFDTTSEQLDLTPDGQLVHAGEDQPPGLLIQSQSGWQLIGCSAGCHYWLPDVVHWHPVSRFVTILLALTTGEAKREIDLSNNSQTVDSDNES